MIVAVLPSDDAFDQAVALFDAYRSHYGLSPSPHDTRTWLSDQLTHSRLTMTTEVAGGRLRGFLTVAPLPASLLLGTFWAVRDLYVAPQHRRAGVARALLHHTVDAARAAGAHRLSLQTETDNEAALALYAAFGFRPVGGLHQLSLPLR
jgi:ribosomal protein S18 acetylase RimI-like enzyme